MLVPDILSGEHTIGCQEGFIEKSTLQGFISLPQKTFLKVQFRTSCAIVIANPE